MRAVAVLSAALLVTVAAGCGASKDVTISRGVIHVPVGVKYDSLRKAVLGIKVGATERDVRTHLGDPYIRVSAHPGDQTCWVYHADQGGSSTTEGPDGSTLDALDFCMSPRHRVARILIGGHA